MADVVESAVLPMPVADSECGHLPQCGCGNVSRYACGSQCEDCFAVESAKFHGNDQLVKTMIH